MLITHDALNPMPARKISLNITIHARWQKVNNGMTITIVDRLDALKDILEEEIYQLLVAFLGDNALDFEFVIELLS